MKKETKILVTGCAGMLGQQLMDRLFRKAYDVTGIDIANTTHMLDLTDEGKLAPFVRELRPDIIIHTAAIVDIDRCEREPGFAYLVNTKAAGNIAKLAHQTGSYLIHISTDHFYTGDQDRKHTETDPIQLINEYAQTKYLAEKLVLLYPETLNIRTNIVGFKNGDRPTFVEWILTTLLHKKPMTLYIDYYFSAIDIYHFSDILMTLIEKRPTGTYNLASREVFTKKDFIEKIAQTWKLSLENTNTGSATDHQGTPRAASCGLCTQALETRYNLEMPDLDGVIARLYQEYVQEGLYGI